MNRDVSDVTLKESRKLKDVQQMTLKEFRALPYNDEVDMDSIRHIMCDAIVIVPGSGRAHELHDSGYRCMSFAVCNENKALFLVAGGSDVIHIGGIGGYGYNWIDRCIGVPTSVPPVDWSIDCLAKSGLLRLFCHRKMILGDALSSFEVWAGQEERGNKQSG